jgi:hypothetical protein
MNARDIKAALNERAEEFARFLFPAGRKIGNEWKVGSLSGQRGDSLSICIAGSKAGVFCDFATGESGDNLIELYAQGYRIEFAEALRACRDWLGVSVTALPGERVAARSVRKAPLHDTEPAKIGMIPDAVLAEWTEGVDYFFSHPLEARQLAEFRGWPLEFTMYAIESDWISMPLYNGKRGVAFKVVAPESSNAQMVTKPVGYHIRLKTDYDGEKASWLYVPNGSQHGQTTPALPLMLGDFDSARLLIITEGEWDAMTFALAAQWLGDACNWPHGVGVIGIRGASGVGTFLKHYRPFWPSGAKCLVLADADRAGEGWYTGEDCFAEKLTKLCRKVAVVRCDGFKDFNDLYRAQTVGPDEIRELLVRHNMSLGNEVAA